MILDEDLRLTVICCLKNMSLLIPAHNSCCLFNAKYTNALCSAAPNIQYISKAERTEIQGTA